MCIQDEYNRKRFARPGALGMGTAVILDFDYLGIVYEVQEFAGTSATLRGSKVPPVTGFAILLHIGDEFIECQGSVLSSTENGVNCWSLAFDGANKPSFLKTESHTLQQRHSLRHQRAKEPSAPKTTWRRQRRPEAEETTVFTSLKLRRCS